MTSSNGVLHGDLNFDLVRSFYFGTISRLIQKPVSELMLEQNQDQKAKKRKIEDFSNSFGSGNFGKIDSDSDDEETIKIKKKSKNYETNATYATILQGFSSNVSDFELEMFSMAVFFFSSILCSEERKRESKKGKRPSAFIITRQPRDLVFVYANKEIVLQAYKLLEIITRPQWTRISTLHSVAGQFQHLVQRRLLQTPV